MADIDNLKSTLRHIASKAYPSLKQPLSDSEYSKGFQFFVQDAGWTIYEEFVLPQLSKQIANLLESRISLSVLEIGPGMKSILGHLPRLQRLTITKYCAFEPNHEFAAKLSHWLNTCVQTETPFPCLESPPKIFRGPFDLEQNTAEGILNEKFDLILFCHSMYGMKPKSKFIERALTLLVEQPESGVVVVFHRDGPLDFDQLVCHQTASFPTGEVCVPDEDDDIDDFASFVAGFNPKDTIVGRAIKRKWRTACRTACRRDKTQPNHLRFSCPNFMATFTTHATALPELITQMPFVNQEIPVKNWEARLRRPAAIVKPKETRHIQTCVRWAVKHKTSLTIVGGGHSAHCLWTGIVAVDMGEFNKINIYPAHDHETGHKIDCEALVVAESGCKIGDIVSKTMEAGLTVPLGARPSVGAGAWLQGGIGHLARMHGLSCDTIVGAVIVSVESGQILCIGNVPSQQQPMDATRPGNENDILWALKGAGNNVGIVVSVTFKAFTAPVYKVRNWIIPLKDKQQAQERITTFEKSVANKLPRKCAADGYLYWEAGHMHLGVTLYECSETPQSFPLFKPPPMFVETILGKENSLKYMNSVELFDAEMYMSGMHGGHGAGKTFSFKRCLFLKNLSAQSIPEMLTKAIDTRPSEFCYLHLLHGGGAIGDWASDASAFGCRDWQYACVVTGVWPRDYDGTSRAGDIVKWVYRVTEDLLPLSCGVYGADLGPDPRDIALAKSSFGPNRQRLNQIKRKVDPLHILRYACPLAETTRTRPQQLVILVTGESGVGKDYCANIWQSEFRKITRRQLAVRIISISDATKRRYAAFIGADLKRLYLDRAYKEQHRPAMTEFFNVEVQQQPQFPETHFVDVLRSAGDADVLIITGMRDKAPLAKFSRLVSTGRLVEVRVRARDDIRRARRRYDVHAYCDRDGRAQRNSPSCPNSTTVNSQASLIFDNNSPGDSEAKEFLRRYLLPLLDENLQRLASMVRLIPDFPRAGVNFHHVLDIPQQPGGLKLCVDLLQSQFTGGWANIHAIACCEAGGYVFASPLALRVDVPLALIRKGGKLPFPKISVRKSISYMSSLTATNTLEDEWIEMSQGVIPKDTSVMVVDDVLSTGHTLSAVFELLNKAGIPNDKIRVMVVAKFPSHRGRQLLQQRGFGAVCIQSLLVFDGA